jgi:hypothetical protein
MAAALRISMLLLLSLLASAPVLAVPAADLLPAAPWAPSAKCQAAADAACNANHSEFGPTVDHGHSCFVDIRSRPCDGPMVARKGHSAAASGPALWRCYSPSTLDANRSRFVKGDCFCSLDPQLRSLLAKCGSPDPTPPPAPPPPPAPHPPAAGGIAVFTSGQDDYHTYRIPAVVAHPADGKRLLTFCEGRKLSSADAGWNDIVVKDSSDAGATWSAMRIVYGAETPVLDAIVLLSVAGKRSFAKTGSGRIYKQRFIINEKRLRFCRREYAAEARRDWQPRAGSAAHHAGQGGARLLPQQQGRAGHDEPRLWPDLGQASCAACRLPDLG